MVGAKYKIGKDESPVVSKERGGRNSSAIRAALAILYDLKQLGYLNYHAAALSNSDGDDVIHREMIEIVYRVKPDDLPKKPGRTEVKQWSLVCM